MSLVGVIWVVLLALKIFGVIHAGWLILIFWPIVPFLLLLITVVVFGASATVLRGY